MGLVAYHAATIDWQSYFVDEVLELAIAHKPAAEIVVEADSMPPLFPLLNKGWLEIWRTDRASRWLSALFSLLTVVAIWKTAREELGAGVSVAAALLAATSPFLLFYAQLVRGYVLYCMLFAWLLWSFLRARRTNRWRDWGLFAVLGAVGCYAHYYFPLYLLTLGIVIAIERKLVRLAPAVWVAFVAIAVAVLPVLALLKTDMTYQQGINNARPLNVAALGYTYASYFTGYSLGPSKNELHQISSTTAIRQMLPWAILLAAALTPLGYRGWGVLRRHGLHWPMLALLVLPVAISGILGQALNLTYNVRFVAPSVVPLLIWLAAGVGGTWSRPSTQLATCLLAAVTVVAISNRQLEERYRNEDIRAACSYIEQIGPTDQPVFVISDYMNHVVRYYASETRPVWQLPDCNAMSLEIHDADDVEQALTTIGKHVDKGQPFWLVYSRPFHGDPDGLLLAHLLDEQAIELAHETAGVRVYRGMARGYSAGSPEVL